MRVVKANSSRWVHEKWDPKFAWQTGYGVFSVSESNVAAVTKYIAEQEEHHRKHSFQEEFVAFLVRNNVAYDERYIWDSVSFALWAILTVRRAKPAQTSREAAKECSPTARAVGSDEEIGRSPGGA